MRTLFKDNVIEALVGLVVLAFAIGFVILAYNRTQSGGGDGYLLKARFPNIAGVTEGTDVRVSGIKVGRVASQVLDPTSFQAVLELSIDKNLKLPADSAASVTTEGLLGGTYIALTPGGDTVMLKPGDEIIETSGSADLMSLVGSMVNRSGGEAETPAAAPAPATAQ